jgi:hypothetical protein
MPTLSQTITATATHDNADGDPVTLTYTWTDTTNNKAGSQGNGVLRTTTNTSSLTDKLNLTGLPGVSAGDTIQVSVVPTSDGLSGTAVLAMAKVIHTTPSATVSLNNVSPTLFDTVTATATTSNADGGAVTLTYQWIDTANNAVLQTTGPTSATTDQLNLKNVTGVNPGDVIEVSVTPTSNGLSGTAATATATVQQTSTPSVSVSLDKSTPTVNDSITASAITSNADGDPVTLTYEWIDTSNNTAGPTGNGVLQTTSNTSALSDKLNLSGLAGVKAGDVIKLSVTPTSDGLSGTTQTATVTIADDSAPVVSAVSITPSGATATSTLTASTTANDFDGDTLTFTYVWTDMTNSMAGASGNGVLQTTSNSSSTTDMLDLANVTGVKSGDKIQVTVTAFDGSLHSDPFTQTITLA